MISEAIELCVEGGQVCKKLNILEEDYFGLQFCGNKNEQLWLNLRNRLDQQLSGHQPYHFQLRIKFCVQPQKIQQDVTRHLYYQQVRHDLHEGRIMITIPQDKVTKLVALACQAEHGNQTNENICQQLVCALLTDMHLPLCPDLIDQVIKERGAVLGLSSHSAEYCFLKEVAQLPFFGFEFHEVHSARGDRVQIGCGPDGLLLKNLTKDRQKSLRYPSIHMVTHREREVYLQLFDDRREPLPALGFKLVSRKAAVALYRCITEMHSFHHCDTVSCVVSEQFSRDLKGTVVSIFNKNSALGKKYIFDIKRTSREAYDYVRRKLHTLLNSSQTPLSNRPIHSGVPNMELGDNCVSLQCQCPDTVGDSLLCCVCLFRTLDTALCPCGHLTCSECASKVRQCPLCRSGIERRQKVFLPTVVDASSESSSGPAEATIENGQVRGMAEEIA